MKVVNRFNLIFSLSFVLLSLGQFVNLKFIGLTSNSFYLFDFYIIMQALFGVIYLAAHFKRVPISYTTISLILFTVFALITLGINNVINNYDDLSSQAFYLVRWASYLIVSFFISVLVQNKKLQLNFIYKVIVLSAFALTCIGFIQLFILPDFTVLDPIYGWDPHKGRLASTFFDPNFAAAYINISLGILLGLFYYQNYEVFSKKILLIQFVVLCIGLFLTFSRSGWGMFVVILGIYGLLKYRWLLLFSFLLAFFAYFAIPRVQTRLSGIADPSDSAHFRLISWSNAVEVFKSSPVIGVGFNSYRQAQKNFNFISPGKEGGNSGAGTDSSLLFVLATTGISGLSIFILGILTSFIRSVNRFKVGGLIPLVILVSLILESNFINSLFYPQIMFTWLIFAQVETT